MEKKLKTPIVVIVSTLLVLGLWTFAGAAGTEIQMCVKNSGVSYVIGTGFAHQSCGSNEQLITFNVQGPQGVQGPTGPQGPEGGSAKVYDANDQVIGYVVYLGGSIEGSWVDTNDRANFQMLDKQTGVVQFVHGDSDNISHAPMNFDIGNFYYASSDCTGQAYLPYVVPKYNYLLQGFGQDNTGFAVDRSLSKPVSFDYLSKAATPTGAGCELESGTLTEPTPVKDVTNIIQSYARPFRVGL